MSSEIRIAIIGAGPGGLTLANILREHRIQFEIFELDSSPNARNQGGTLDLHPQDGQLALREAGLWQQFVKHARPESDVMKILTLTGEILWDGNGPDARVVSELEKYNHRPEIDRSALKQILVEGLDSKFIHWDKKLVEAVTVPGLGDTYDLHFDDGTVEKTFNVVIGADGAWSKVRTLLTNEKPFYSGISGIEVSARDVENNFEWMSDFVGRGSCFAFGEGRAVQAQRLGDGSIRTYANLRKPENFIKDCAIDWSKHDSARSIFVDKYFSDCADGLKRLITESPDALIPRALYMLPVGFRWTSRPGITLLGDAAHLMTPFAGVGVNAALADALALAHALISYTKGKNLAEALKEYEEDLFIRGEKFAQKTAHGLKKHFSETGSEEMAGRLKAAFGGRK